jgi:hypothetical protein
MCPDFWLLVIKGVMEACREPLDLALVAIWPGLDHSDLLSGVRADRSPRLLMPLKEMAERGDRCG